MTQCVFIHVEIEITIRTFGMHITAKFVMIDELHVRLKHDAKWHDITIDKNRFPIRLSPWGGACGTTCAQLAVVGGGSVTEWPLALEVLRGRYR